MKTAKRIGIALGALCLLGLSALAVLLLLGFRFSSDAAVHERYRDAILIETEDYDFYLCPISDSNGEAVYAELPAAVRKYGFLYKRVSEEDEVLSQRALTAQNGDHAGEIYSYTGESGTHHFIRWIGHFEPDKEGAFLKYMCDTVTVNGEKKELYLRTYFVSEGAITSLLTDKTALSLSDEWVKPAVSLFAPKPEDTPLAFWITDDVRAVSFAGYERIDGWMGAEQYYGIGYGAKSEYYVKYLITHWPDHADVGSRHITKIEITDPAVTVYGLSVLSSAEDFRKVFQEKGFFVTEEKREKSTVLTAKKYGVSFTLHKTEDDSFFKLTVAAEVTNRENINY